MEATDEDGEGVAPADFAKQASATNAAADEAAASKRAASDKAQAAIGTVHFVTDAFLLAGGAVPVFGDFFDLIAHFKEQCVGLLGRVDEANEVETWAQDEVNMLEEIEKQIYQCADTGSNGWAANGLRRAAIKLNECIKQLEAEATRISAGGTKARQLFRATIHKRNFESAQGAVADARKIFSLALTVDSNERLRRIEHGLEEIKAQFGDIRAQLAPGARSVALFNDFEERGEEMGDFYVDATSRHPNEDGIEASLDQLLDFQERVARVAKVVPANVRIRDLRGGSIIVDFRVHFGKKAEAEKFRDTLLRNAPASLAPSALGAFEIQKAVVGRVVTKQMIGSLWFALGYAHYELNGMKSCEASYEPYTRCIELDPTHAEAHSNLGNLLRDVRKDYDGAERSYRKAIELEPSCVEAYNGLGVVQRVRKDYDAELRQKLAPARGGDGPQKASPDDAVDASMVGWAEDVATTPSEAEPMKVLQSIGDASAVATASRRDLRFRPVSSPRDDSLRTLEGHSDAVRCGVHCTFVMMRLRRRSMVLPSYRTGGASCLGRATRRSRCGK